MPSLSFFLKLSLAYLKRFKAVIVFGVFLGIIIFIFVRTIIPLIFNRSVEKIGLTGRYHTEDLPPRILNLIGDGLTKVDSTGNPEPNLAQSWETPDKGKTWIFHIKDGVYWQDETPVTSDTIVYKFSDVTIKKPDTKTLVFELKDPYSAFPVVVSRPTFKKGLLGTGKWRVEKITLSGAYVNELILKSASQKKIFKFYPTLEATKLAMKLGEIDQIEETLDPSPFNTWQNLKISSSPNLNQVVTLFFKTTDKYLSEKSLRQALTYAIDKDKLGVRAISPISPNSWAFNPQVKEYKYDPQRAKELIENLPKEIKENIEIRLVSTPLLLSTAESITKDWEKIGVKTTLQVSSIMPSDFSAFLTILEIPVDPDQYEIWHSTQKSNNISNFSSPRIDKLLEDGRTELNLEERKKIYLDFQRFLLEDLPAAFLYHPTYYTISRK